MFVPPGMDQLERMPECLPKARGVVAHDRQAAALFRSIHRESGDDDVPSGLQGLL